MATARGHRIAVVALMAGMLAFGAVPASAEDVKIVAPPPAGERSDVAGRLPSSRPSDEIYYPGHGPIVPHDPAIIFPFSAPSRDSRMGLAGWTSPNMPVGASGAGLRENNGWLALGFAWTWGAAPRAREASRAPSGPGPGAGGGSYASPGEGAAPAAPEQRTR